MRRDWIDIEYTAGGTTYSESLPLDIMKEMCGLDTAMPLDYEDEQELVEHYIRNIVLNVHWRKELRYV